MMFRNFLKTLQRLIVVYASSGALLVSTTKRSWPVGVFNLAPLLGTPKRFIFIQYTDTLVIDVISTVPGRAGLPSSQSLTH